MYTNLTVRARPCAVAAPPSRGFELEKPHKTWKKTQELLSNAVKAKSLKKIYFEQVFNLTFIYRVTVKLFHTCLHDIQVFLNTFSVSDIWIHGGNRRTNKTLPTVRLGKILISSTPSDTLATRPFSGGKRQDLPYSFVHNLLRMTNFTLCYLILTFLNKVS